MVTVSIKGLNCFKMRDCWLDTFAPVLLPTDSFVASNHSLWSTSCRIHCAIHRSSCANTITQWYSYSGSPHPFSYVIRWNQWQPLTSSKVKYTSISTAQYAIPLMRSWDHLSYGITQCYLPPDRGDSHAFTPACCQYSFINPRRMKVWVDLGSWLYQDRLPTDGHPSKY